MFLNASHTIFETAKTLRENQTEAEKKLWNYLKQKPLGYKFRRQHPIAYQAWERKTNFYVADFYCAAKKIVVELDGKHHEFPDQKEYDSARDKLMNQFGIKVLRIKNEELKNIRTVLRKIEEMLL